MSRRRGRSGRGRRHSGRGRGRRDGRVSLAAAPWQRIHQGPRRQLRQTGRAERPVGRPVGRARHDPRRHGRRGAGREPRRRCRARWRRGRYAGCCRGSGELRHKGRPCPRGRRPGRCGRWSRVGGLRGCHPCRCQVSIGAALAAVFGERAQGRGQLRGRHTFGKGARRSAQVGPMPAVIRRSGWKRAPRTQGEDCGPRAQLGGVRPRMRGVLQTVRTPAAWRPTAPTVAAQEPLTPR